MHEQRSVTKNHSTVTFVFHCNQKVGKYVQYLEEWNLLQQDISDRVERAVPPELPQRPKKKRRTQKQDATSQQRIESYMSNTFLGRMRGTGQFKEAPVSKGFFERYKKKSKKAKKGVKIEPKKEGDKQLKQLKFLVGKKDWKGLDLFWIWRLLTCMDVA